MSKHELGLRLIAIGKLVKVVTLVTIGIVALAAAGDDPGLLDMAERLGLNPGGRNVRWVLGARFRSASCPAAQGR